MPQDHDKLLVIVLQEEVASLEDELETVRESFRYQAGQLLVEGLASPGRRGLTALLALLRLVREKRRQVRGAVDPAGLPEAGTRADLLVFGASVPDGHGLGERVLVEADPVRLVAMVQRAPRPSTLVLRDAPASVLRHLEAWRLQGWRVIWWPQASGTVRGALLEYVRSHCDRVMGEAPR
ncbi:hypothetical protein [Thioalkalivibrio sp. ALE11]|uniref:hypothetical protein n=1 Tax=Thioalkalivibrio sp. ALE11 TaxID=1265494 RepID=UPI000379174B|nr:hypothetical protein [Thioalkalivibrio sp. ALE11]